MIVMLTHTLMTNTYIWSDHCDLYLCCCRGGSDVDSEAQPPQHEGGDSDWAEDITAEDEDSAGEDSVSQLSHIVKIVDLEYFTWIPIMCSFICSDVIDLICYVFRMKSH